MIPSFLGLLPHLGVGPSILTNTEQHVSHSFAQLLFRVLCISCTLWDSTLPSIEHPWVYQRRCDPQNSAGHPPSRDHASVDFLSFCECSPPANFNDVIGLSRPYDISQRPLAL